jgi:dTDP-4-dehydrorhamnose 3,5-epimerase
MNIIKRKFAGVCEIQLNPIFDQRGFFMRTWDIDLFKKSGLQHNWVQENHSRSEKKGIIRGVHFQFPPFSETKLVRCIKGAILDVFVDLRKDSESFGQWDSIELNEENKKMILVPKGFAHGFCTLSEISEVVYKVDNNYSKEHEAGIIWNDETLSIKWPVIDAIISERDSGNMTFTEFKNRFKGIVI